MFAINQKTYWRSFTCGTEADEENMRDIVVEKVPVSCHFGMCLLYLCGTLAFRRWCETAVGREKIGKTGDRTRDSLRSTQPTLLEESSTPTTAT